MPSASRVRGRFAYGGVLLVPVRVQGHDAEFLMDTGAAHTALRRDLVNLLGLSIDLQRTAAIAPVQGTIMRVPLITIAELSVGGFQVANVDAVVVEFPRELKLDGVLGMNFLKRFRMTIEMDTCTLVLRPIGRYGSTGKRCADEASECLYAFRGDSIGAPHCSIPVPREAPTPYPRLISSHRERDLLI